MYLLHIFVAIVLLTKLYQMQTFPILKPGITVEVPTATTEKLD